MSRRVDPAQRATPEPRPPGSGGWIRRLSPFLLAHRRDVALAFGMAVAGQAVSAGTPIISKVVIDDVITHHDRPLAPWLVLLVAAGVFGFAAAYVRRFVGGRVSLDVQFDLRNAVYERLQRLDFGSHDQLQTGQLVSRASSDVGAACKALLAVPADHARQPRDARRVAGRDALALAAADARGAGCDPAAAPRRAATPDHRVPGVVGRAAAGRRGGRRRRRGGDRRAGREGVRPGGPRARPPRRRRQPTCTDPESRLIRLQARYTPALSADPGARPRSAVLGFGGWLAIDGQHHPRHVPGLLVVPRAARGAGADVRHCSSRSRSRPEPAPSGSSTCSTPTRRRRAATTPSSSPPARRRRALRRRPLRLHDAPSRCSTASPCTSPPARPSPSSAAAARASPPWPLLLPRFYDVADRRGHDRRHRRPRRHARLAARPGRRGVRGVVPVLRLGAGQHRLRPARRHRRRGAGRRPGRGGRRVHRAPCPTATTPWSASGGSRCPAGSASASPWPGPSSPTPGS